MLLNNAVLICPSIEYSDGSSENIDKYCSHSIEIRRTRLCISDSS